MKKTVTVLNILLVLGMVLHIGITMYDYSQHFWPAPIWVNLFYAIFYIIPIILFNLANWIITFVTKKK